MQRPKITLSFAMSLDGFIDDATSQRLAEISSPEDYAHRDFIRSEHDVIFIGANTIRKDQPRGTIHNETLRKQQPNYTKITLTRSGNLDPDNTFFQHDTTPTIVYAQTQPDAIFPDHVQWKIGAYTLKNMFEDLQQRWVKNLLIEGGSQILHQCLQENLYDTLLLTVAPFLIGDSNAVPAFAPGAYPITSTDRLQLIEVTQRGDCACMTYTNPYARS